LSDTIKKRCHAPKIGRSTKNRRQSDTIKKRCHAPKIGNQVRMGAIPDIMAKDNFIIPLDPG